MTDVAELVEKATAKGTFSVLDAVKGIAYPTDTVKVHTDIEAAYLIKHLNVKAADELDPDQVDKIDAQVNELKERIAASDLVFTLRGYAPTVVRAINDEAKERFAVEDTDNGEAAEWCNYKYVAEAIVQAENAEGATDSHRWEVDELKGFALSLPDGEFDKITELMAALVFTAAYFDQVVDADFS